MIEIRADGCLVRVAGVVGYQHENNRAQIRFPLDDVLDIVTENPGGSYAVVYKRMFDEQFFTSTDYELDGAYLIWNVSSHVVAVRGDLEVQIVYSTDQQIAETQIYHFKVARGLMEDEEGQGENLSDLIEQALLAAGTVDQAIYDAQQTLDEKVTAAQTAQTAAEAAQTAAERAQHTAENAKTSAAQSANAAYNFAADANTAKRDATNAKDAAVQAKGAAETAKTAAETAQAAADADALKAEGYAVGTQNGTPAAEGQPYYQDNAKYYKEQAEAAKTAAEAARDTAQQTVAGIEAAGTAQVGRVAAEGATQVGNVQNKGQQVLDSIPDDYSELSNDVTNLKSAMNWIGQGKNLCGLDPNVYYPVCLDAGEYLTMSTADGSNCGYSGMYLYVYDANKTQLNYYTFPSDASQRTIKLSTDYKVRFIRWARDIHKNLQVEIGETKTAYEPYWGNALALSSAIVEVNERFDSQYGNNNIVGNIEDNKYLEKTTGRVFDNESYRASDFIAIVPGNTYKLGLFNQNNAPSFEYNSITVCFYDAGTNGLADTFVYASGYDHIRCDWDGGFIKFVAPNNAYFIRVGVNDSASPLKWFVIDYSASDLYADGNEIKSQIVTDNTALQGKRVAVFGDSIMGNTRDVTSTPAFISKACGATVFNFGFGGCRMSVHKTGWDNCSMYRLADDIYADDFTSLVSAINTGWSGMPGYYRNTVAWLNACDFSKVDVIIIAYGTNDYREPSSILDNSNNKFDTSTVCGALRYSIKQILSKYPGVQILVTCPIFRTFFQDGTTTPEEYSDTKDWGSGTLLQYEEAYKQACADMNVPFLDLYHETSFNPYTRLYFYPADDGTHPNEKGRERIGNIIGGRIKTLLPSN